MDRFIRVFGRAKDVVIGMVHVRALPGMYYYYYMIYIAPISRIESEALASLGGEHD